MSWSDVFPILTDEMVETFFESASAEERFELDELFGVRNVFNLRAVPGARQHVVAASLFWKNTKAEEPDLPPLSRDLLKRAPELCLVRRFSPWEHYVQPLLDGAEVLAVERPEIIFRVYLAADMDFLVQDFVERNCEVHLMRSPSLRHNPGAMWRFLALEHEGLVTITDSDRAPDVLHDIERTELVVKHGLGHWRVAYIWGDEEYDCSHYRTIMACQFGSASPLPAGDLMRAMLWHTKHGSLPTHCTKGSQIRVQAFGSNWPDYGFDEWFLNVAVHPRIAFSGVLTFVPWNDRKLNHWFALDIEYVTWANSKSEIIYYGSPLPMDSQPAEVLPSDLHLDDLTLIR
jgi:hypothetical protein